MFTGLLAFSLFNLLRDFIEKLLSILQTAVFWLVSTVVGWLAQIASLLPFSQMSPGASSQYTDSAITWMRWADSWVPVTTGIALFSLYWILYVGIQVYRFVKSWVPTVSG